MPDLISSFVTQQNKNNDLLAELNMAQLNETSELSLQVKDLVKRISELEEHGFPELEFTVTPIIKEGSS